MQYCEFIYNQQSYWNFEFLRETGEWIFSQLQYNYIDNKTTQWDFEIGRQVEYKCQLPSKLRL